jgi:hypothetical protein
MLQHWRLKDVNLNLCFGERHNKALHLTAIPLRSATRLNPPG